MNERGAITFGPVVGVIVIILALIGLFAVCSDDDEVNSLGRMQWASHEYDEGGDCDWSGQCGGYEGGYEDGDGGYSGGPSGGYYEGGKGGSDYDGDGDGNRCRNFCVYPVQPPDGGGRM